MPHREDPSLLDRGLRVFADVRTGEGYIALLLALNIFLILMAYYVLKPVREALVLGEGSAELKSYLSAGQVVLLAFVVPFYGRLVARLPRMKLINTVTLFFAACPVIFYGLNKAGIPLAIIFFVWIGIFSLMVIAQFWSFATDIYTKPEGERLFPIVGFGASLGAVFGARIADRLIEPIGVYELMLVGGAILLGQLWLTNYINRHRGQRDAATPAPAAASTAVPAAAKPSGTNAFALVFRTRYLLLMALMLMMLNWVNSTGEYILGRIVTDAAQRMVAEGRAGGLTTGQIIGDFYSKYFTLVNGLGLLLQLFVVSRVVKRFGIPIAVMVLPVLSLTAYNVMLFLPFLWAVLSAKVAENATDYSLNNTVRNMLFLPCTPEEKYSAKQAIDAFFFRAGDVLSALTVFVGTAGVALGTKGFAAVNVVLAVGWVALAWRVGRAYQGLTAEQPAIGVRRPAPAGA
jgi:ATP:ADP antiporter, AAA family